MKPAVSVIKISISDLSLSEDNCAGKKLCAWNKYDLCTVGCVILFDFRISKTGKDFFMPWYMKLNRKKLIFQKNYI